MMFGVRGRGRATSQSDSRSEPAGGGGKAVEVGGESDIPAETNMPKGRVRCACDDGIRECPQPGVGHAERHEGGRRCEGPAVVRVEGVGSPERGR
jgi:hypothetical protein